VSAVRQAEAEHRLATALRTEVGDRPILLCGSRALGSAGADSDYDVVVVLPSVLVPIRLRRLRPLARRLEAEIGVPVSVSPLPAERLHRSDSLFLWKLRREGRVLSAPPGFALPDAGPAPLTSASAFSYLACAALYLLTPVTPSSLEGRRLPADVEHGVSKCLLHLAQLRLMRRGAYAETLEGALEELGDARISALARRAALADGLLGTRDELLQELEPLLDPPVTRLAVGAKARYVTLAALRGRVRVRAALAPGPLDHRLARAGAELLRALRPDGAIDVDATHRAVALLPFDIAEGSSAWDAAREVVIREWPEAHPLGAQ
jgi:predicted nucleotidyltransferase